MSSPVTPLVGAAAPTTAMPTARTQAADSRDFAAELDAVERGVAIDAHTSAPPAQLLDEMSAAAATHDRLAAEGVHLSFSAAGAGTPSLITLREADGTATTISAAAAGDIACGGSPG